MPFALWRSRRAHPCPGLVESLLGHTSAVESVCFDSTEKYVAAGATSGTIKLSDLEEGKDVCTLTGHMSNCMSVDFHRSGEYIASGSLDTNLKIWDIRTKGAIRFTPNGRCVVSGGKENIVKVWDMKKR